MNKKMWNNSSVIIILILLLTNSCKKDKIHVKTDPLITWSNPADIRYETLLSEKQLNATTDISGTFVYTPSLGTKLNIGLNQDLKVDFTPTDQTTYNTISKSVKINVNSKIDPEIIWSNPADIRYGTLLGVIQLNAVADVSGKYVYTPPLGAKLNIGSNQDLKVDFTPTDTVNYNTTSKTVKINVIAKKDPVISWLNPANITYSTTLNSVHLNATADVPGTFVYNPGIGYKLSEGMNQDLSVDFTPTDLASYNTISKTVKINVIGALIVFNKNKTYGVVTDIDGNVYKTIVIGSQTWMAENLKTTKYNDGTPIPIETNPASWETLTTGAYCYYNNDTNKRNTYGMLYNFYTVVDTRKLCPNSWHVSTDDEWTTLLNYFPPWPADKLLETSKNHWVNNNIWVDNSSGFTALPGGYCNSVGTFSNNLGAGYWWCPTGTGKSNARDLNAASHYAGYQNYLKKNTGYSIRCVKD